MKHAKGPWTIDRGEDTAIRNSQGQRIALEVSTHLRYEYREANAKLIAAAPELLVACKATFISIADSIGEDPQKDWKESLADALECLDGAINKAEGK